MAKITSKLQISIPKVLTERFHFNPGDEIDFIAGSDSIRIQRHIQAPTGKDVKSRLASFDAATARAKIRKKKKTSEAANRGWTREELYQRGHTL